MLASLKCVSVVIPKVQTSTLRSVFEDDMPQLREGYHAHSTSFLTGWLRLLKITRNLTPLEGVTWVPQMCASPEKYRYSDTT